MDPLTCAACGMPAPVGSCRNLLCRSAARSWLAVFAAGEYRNRLRSDILAYKAGEQALAGRLAEVLAQFLRREAPWFEEFDTIVAVPGYRGTQARRSWDPVHLLHQELAARVGDSWACPVGVLAKSEETPALCGRAVGERRYLAATALRTSLHVARAEEVTGRRILVLDDVMADGSTLQETGQQLIGHGALEVSGLVLARAVWHGRPRSRGPV